MSWLIWIKLKKLTNPNHWILVIAVGLSVCPSTSINDSSVCQERGRKWSIINCILGFYLVLSYSFVSPFTNVCSYKWFSVPPESNTKLNKLPILSNPLSLSSLLLLVLLFPPANHHCLLVLWPSLSKPSEPPNSSLWAIKPSHWTGKHASTLCQLRFPTRR